MMRFQNAYPLLLISFLSFSANAQQAVIDSIEKLVPGQRDSILAGSYNELTWQYRTIDQDKAIDYGHKAIELGNKINFPKAVAQAFNDLGIIYYDKQDFLNALSSYKKAYEIRLKLGDKKGIAALYNKIGIVYQKESRFDSALIYAQKALELYEQINDKIGISYSLNNIGIVNQNVGNLDEAIKYQQQSIAIKEEINDKLGLSGSYVNLGNIYLQKNETLKAKQYFEKAENISRQIGNPEYLSNALNNLASLYQKMGNYNKAIPMIEESLNIRIKLGDIKGEVSCLVNWGALLTESKNYAGAENKYLAGLKLADTLVSCRSEKAKLYDGLSMLYQLTGDYKKSMEMARHTIEINNSIYTDQMNQRFSEMETKFQTAKKDKQIQEQQFELIKKQYWLYGSVALAVLLALLGYSYNRRRELKQEKRLQLEVIRQQDIATKGIINAEENERKRIAADLHDGIGQMMSAAKMNLSVFESELTYENESQKNAFEKVIDLIDESCKELRAVSHQMMPNALLKAGLSTAVKEFISRIDSRIIKISLHTEGLQERLDTNIETVLYRVIQECVNNVLKHAAASQLDISLLNDEDGISVTIEDNGKGFDSKNLKDFEGIGLKNMYTRISYLKGNIDFDSSPGKGTLVAIHIPTS
ncbi:MAG: sensor histidine kinase [Ferruginibacter sp.]